VDKNIIWKEGNVRHSGTYHKTEVLRNYKKSG